MTMTKLRQILWILPLSWLCLYGTVEAATLHVIIVADTNDTKINANKDLANIKTMVENVSMATGLPLNLQVFEGDTISKNGNGYQQVRNTVEQLRSHTEDVIMFYYTGHGVKDWKGGEWPAMELQGEDSPDNRLLRLFRVKEILQQQAPRLLMVMADTCNKVDPTRGRAEVILRKVEPSTKAAYQALFLSSQGIIMASGAERGQNASGDKNGGFFTQGFLTSLKAELKSPQPSWDTIMDNTKEWVQKFDQIPQIQVAIQVIGDDNEPPPEPARKLTVNQFDTNSAELKPFHKFELQQWEQGLTGSKSLTPPSVRVEGHTDSRGTEEHNFALSKQRATSVKRHLVEELGANPDRFDIIPYGESQLVASEDTEEGRALNRRVELVSEFPMAVTNNEEDDRPSSPQVIPADTDNDDDNQASLPVPEQVFLEPLKICSEPSSSFGACYWETDNDNSWNFFVEEKLWLNSWHGWELSSGNTSKSDAGYNINVGGEHLVSILSEPELTSIITLGVRYKRFSLGLSILPKRAYEFPKFERSIGWQRIGEEGNIEELRNSIEEVITSAEREEIDITIGYSILPQLTIGAGFKRATIDYTYSNYSDNPFTDTPTSNERWNFTENYKTYGVSLNIGGQVCLASWVGANISMFGNFSYGLLKTDWSNGDSDPNIYHSTDLGLAWELPIQKFKPEIRFGYRAQTMYTEAYVGDPVDTTEGFTLGLRVNF